MNSRNLFVPALVLIGGAIIGRVIGVKPIIKGAMKAANFAGYGPGDLAKKAARNVGDKTVRRVRRAVRTSKPASKATTRRAAASRKPAEKKTKAA